MAETELERAEKRYEQARARLQALKNREATKSRKIDTRRKVILGGALMDLATRDAGAAAMLERLIRNLPREQDRRAFVEGGGADDGSSGGAGAGGSSGTGDKGPSAVGVDGPAVGNAPARAPSSSADPGASATSPPVGGSSTLSSTGP